MSHPRSFWQGCWLCQRGGASAAVPTHTVETLFQRSGAFSKVAFACMFCHDEMGRSVAHHSRRKLHEVKAPPKALGQPLRVGRNLLTRGSNWGAARFNRNLTRPRSCLRAKLQSFSTDTGASELVCFQCGVFWEHAQGRCDENMEGLQRRQDSWMLGGRDKL